MEAGNADDIKTRGHKFLKTRAIRTVEHQGNYGTGSILKTAILTVDMATKVLSLGTAANQKRKILGNILNGGRAHFI
jgi:hypothetical protein